MAVEAIAGPWYTSFPKLSARPSLKTPASSSAGRYGRTACLRPPKTLEKKEGVPR